MNIENVKNGLGADADRLEYEILPVPGKGDIIRCAFKRFQSKEVFGRVARNIKGMGGEYVSAGKQSHFQVPTANQARTPQPSSYPEVVHESIQKIKNDFYHHYTF